MTAPARVAPAATLQWLLFDDESPPGATPAPAGVDAAHGAGYRPPAAATPPAIGPLRHPDANREVVLGERRIGYLLKRARRRSIGFIVGPSGLAVNAPKWVGVADIDAALQAKAGWILRKLDEQQQRGAQQQAARIAWHDGAVLPYLGGELRVRLDPDLPRAARAGVHTVDADADAGPRQSTLHLGLPHNAAPAQIRDAVTRWLQRDARRIFDARCSEYAPRLGVRHRRLSLSSARTRWGSASASGAIRLNWRLIHFSLHTIDYVVIHELAHLREMNHSARFWDIVRSLMPDFDRARIALKRDLLPLLD